MFFVIGVMRTCGSPAEVKRPETALRLFLRFILARAAVAYGMEGMLALLSVVQGITATVLGAAGLGAADPVTLPPALAEAIEACGFLESVPLWAVTLIGSLLIWVLSFVMILNVYGRFFRLYMYTAIAPVPLAALAGEPTQNMGKSFLKSYAAVCLEGAVIVLACLLFSALAEAPRPPEPGTAAAAMVWNYIGELVFNMLILVGSVKAADRIVKEMMGLT